MNVIIVHHYVILLNTATKMESDQHYQKDLILEDA